MMGGRDFSVVGRPLLPLSSAFVEACVVEKKLSHTTIWYKKTHAKPNKMLCELRYFS